MLAFRGNGLSLMLFLQCRKAKLSYQVIRHTHCLIFLPLTICGLLVLDATPQLKADSGDHQIHDFPAASGLPVDVSVDKEKARTPRLAFFLFRLCQNREQ